jgi:hypothetical protein
VAEVSLQRPGVVPFVCERVAAGVPQHVGMRLEPELGLGPGSLDHAGKPRRRERHASLRREHEG